MNISNEVQRLLEANGFRNIFHCMLVRSLEKDKTKAKMAQQIIDIAERQEKLVDVINLVEECEKQS